MIYGTMIHDPTRVVDRIVDASLARNSVHLTSGAKHCLHRIIMIMMMIFQMGI